MIDKEAYSPRIAAANPAQLVVINFELLLEYIAAGEYGKAKDALDSLIRGLNFEIELAHDFYGIYKYVYELLTAAQFSREPEKAAASANEAREHLEALLEGWRDAEKQVAALPPVVGEAPKQYAGLTYGRDGTADEYIDDDSRKGYMA